MNKLLIILLSVFLISCGGEEKEQVEISSVPEEFQFIDKVFKRADQLYKVQLQVNGNPDSIPRSIENDGSLKLVTWKDWTCGFYAGTMWFLYEYNQDEFWLTKAREWTEALEPVQFKTNTHDVGFMIYCSYGNGYRITKNGEYLPVIEQTSKTLCKRYRETVGCTKSWNRYKFSEKWQYPVIIDNMMNLDMLHFAGKKFENDTFTDIAESHAETTMKNHFREDFSSYHVIDYDSITGEVLQRNTHQGLYDSSSWARGQAWGLYGYTVQARETGRDDFLAQAVNIADYIMTSEYLPEDLIPLWDYHDQRENAPRDASAAAITASALLDLSKLVNEEEGNKYVEFAEKTLKTLSSDKYLNKVGENHNFILLHCTGNHPRGTEIDKPLNYGDYYFLEALLRYKELKWND